jgi:hypothetical protein
MLMQSKRLANGRKKGRKEGSKGRGTNNAGADKKKATAA